MFRCISCISFVLRCVLLYRIMFVLYSIQIHQFISIFNIRSVKEDQNEDLPTSLPRT